MKTVYEQMRPNLLLPKELFELSRNATIVTADNVADYFYIGTEKDIWWVGRDYPNLAPPFQNFFIEYGPPTQLVTSMGLEKLSPDSVFRQQGLLRYGFHFRAIDNLYRSSGHLLESANVGRWHVEIIPYTLTPEGVVQPGYAWLISVDEYGKPIAMDHPSGATYCRIYRLAPLLPDDNLVAAHSLFTMFCAPALLSICFMHCKNVELIERGPHLRPPGTRNRRGPRIKYYTLEIEPMKKVLRTEGQSETTGLKKALHICRGHFAHYSADKPLFGKYEGTFWRPMHTRGSSEQGAVIKDYEIGKVDKPPTDG